MRSTLDRTSARRIPFARIVPWTILFALLTVGALARAGHDAGPMPEDPDPADAGLPDDSEAWIEIPEVEEEPEDYESFEYYGSLEYGQPARTGPTAAQEEPKRDPSNPYYLTNPFMSVGIGGGYIHPILGISRRHGPGAAMHLDAVFFGERWGFGLDIRMLASLSSNEEIVLPDDPNGTDGPTHLTSQPIAFFVGLSGRYVLHKSHRWFVSIGLTVGFMDYHLTFEESPSGNVKKYQEFERERTGIGFLEDIEVAYLFFSGSEAAIGAYLSIGIAEAYSRDTDEIQPDLGRKDGTEYGLELWPQFIMGLKVLASDDPKNRTVFLSDVEQRHLDRRIFRVDLSFGYSHPLGKVSADYSPGMAFTAHLLLRWKQELGLYFAGGFSSSSSDQVVLQADSEHNEKAWPITLESEPAGFSTGFVFNPIVVTHNSLLLSAGLHLGFAWRAIGRGSASDKEGDPVVAYESFRRERGGIAVGQHLDGCWFFAGNDSAAAGLFLRASIDEAYTWSLKKYQPDLDGPDDKVYGLEWWPSITGGFIGML